MSKVFISYARQDREQARRLAELLTQGAHEVWWDHLLLPGQAFRSNITESLEAADKVIVLWSEASVASMFVIDEAQYASKAGKLIPLTIDKLDPPIGFRQIHTLHVSDFRREIDEILKAIDSPRLLTNSSSRVAIKSTTKNQTLIKGAALTTLAFGICVFTYALIVDAPLNPEFRYRTYDSDPLRLKFVYPQKHLMVDNSREPLGTLTLVSPERQVEARITRAKRSHNLSIRNEREDKTAELQQKGFELNYVAPRKEADWSNWYVLSGVMPDGREFYYKRWHIDSDFVSFEFEYPQSKLDIYHTIIEDLMSKRLNIRK